MPDLELVVLFLLLAVIALTAIAERVNVPYPIFLVIGGSALGFVPGVPDVRLDPDLVLLLFLPPLLFNLAYFASLRDLRRSARPIVLSAFVLVLLTAGATAVALKLAAPDISWAAAFTFGAIASPTDPLAAVAIAQRLGVPRRLIVVIEGESLINDGTALVLYRTAAAAVGGSFVFGDAAWDFVRNFAGGAAVGVVVGLALVPAFRHLRDPVLGIALSIAAGYLGYLPAEHLHVSGVIAAVCVGLVVGQRSHLVTDAAARLRGYAFWEVFVFLLNAVLFVLVGLQLPQVLDAQTHSSLELAGLGALSGAVVIAARLVYLNTMPYLVRAIDRRPQQRERRVGWRERLVVGWSGLRGAVSLAAALALPPTFPERDLIVFLTLCVIFATLVLQGLTLPLLIRVLGVEDDGATERETLEARRALTEVAIAEAERLRAEEWTREDTLDRMIGLQRFRQRRIDGQARDGEDPQERSIAYQRTVRLINDAQRRELHRLRLSGEVSAEVTRELERELDLEDERLEI